MEKFPAEKFAYIFSHLGAATRGNMDVPSLSSDAFGELCFQLKVVMNNCLAVGLPVSALQIEAAVEHLQQFPGLPGVQIAQTLALLGDAITSEMKTRLFLRVSAELAKFYEKNDLFGPEVAEVVPDAAYDIKECGNCIATGRPTAAVFHAMRAMEVALKRIAKRMRVKYAPSWEGYFRQIEPEIEKRLKSGKRVDSFYVSALARLRAVKDAVRNGTMHADTVFTEEEAMDVLNSTAAFMRGLAIRLKKS